jgi:DNA (cytosine-5)-methyltransferase 1
MSAYYNEHDPKAAAWLRELISQGHIAPGEVDERSITEIQPHELNGYTQCHFFAGIGGWSLALRLAGWPDSRPAWTGSCPCQPFSALGKQLGAKDERHLWPAFFNLIKEGSPEAVFGEQVSSTEVVGSEQEAAFVNAVQGGDFAKANKLAKRLVRQSSFSYDRRWLDGVFADLESAHYTCGASDIPAAGIGAPHIRQRAWWVAYADLSMRDERARSREQQVHHENGGLGGLGHADSAGSLTGRQTAATNGHGRPSIADGCASGLADLLKPGLEGFAGDGDHGNQPGRLGTIAAGSIAAGGGAGAERLEYAASNGRGERRAESGRRSIASGCGWSDFDIIPCRDGKARRIESGTFPLAHGIPHRVGLLRGYGNAIIAELAAQFIQASEEARELA